ncbi:MAG: hypothetical protein HS111_38945 [Kofleriaceae bacterium]|nr:hypothetical protein [Kofleriaceae bacterium]MCL4226615.1 hypothetical protein [Myxococcales bacterium]
MPTRQLSLVTLAALALALAAGCAVAPAGSRPAAATPAAPVALTPQERALLARGEISGDRRVIGVVVSVVPGFGLGHVVQGRWRERGWIFTVGEVVAFGFIAAAAVESDLSAPLVGALAAVGWGGYLGLRVWEVTDAVTGPPRHNRRVRTLQARAP